MAAKELLNDIAENWARVRRTIGCLHETEKNTQK
ncbi:hypothetical protein COLO4_00453 [Corchorus olitorius]|uniref:Uncharacterized protein n=1 Tax=Corchorus olitorius TaxID=93759 RepID=A0A1R3L3X5_9ROSI|nr:hypothetical protein COLO4_00453 [Corchorus olitorius]